MISMCSWYYERDSGPTSVELGRALIFGPEEASRDRAMQTNAILREHFETHTPEEWATEISNERRRANDHAARQREAEKALLLLLLREENASVEFTMAEMASAPRNGSLVSQHNAITGSELLAYRAAGREDGQCRKVAEE